MREKYTTSFFLHDLVLSYGCDKVGYLFHARDTHGRLHPPLRMTRENERCTVLLLDFSIRSITSLMWGIPRSAYHLALNDEVGRKVLVIILNRTRSLTITASS